jgi:hypothetical protein
MKKCDFEPSVKCLWCDFRDKRKKTNEHQESCEFKEICNKCDQPY